MKISKEESMERSDKLEQKRQLALILWHKAGDIIEMWDEQTDSLMSKREAAQHLMKWLKMLPGHSLDLRVYDVACGTKE